MARYRIMLLALATAAAASRASSGQQPARAPESAQAHRLVIHSTPSEALIVVNASDTLDVTPLSFPVRRHSQFGQFAPVIFEALPIAPGLCTQALLIEYDAPLPDTIQFDLTRCPPASLDPAAVFDTSEVTIRPTRVSSPAVRYPEDMRQAGRNGRVVLAFVIDTSGRAEPTSVQVLEASPSQFSPPAVEVVLRSRFWPGRIVGKKVRVRVRMPINFSIARAG